MERLRLRGKIRTDRKRFDGTKTRNRRRGTTEGKTMKFPCDINKSESKKGSIVSRPESSFICPICRDLMRDTRITKACEHRFCKDCIIKWIGRQAGQTCPICKHPLRTKRDVDPDPTWDENIKQSVSKKSAHDTAEEKKIIEQLKQTGLALQQACIKQRERRNRFKKRGRPVKSKPEKTSRASRAEKTSAKSARTRTTIKAPKTVKKRGRPTKTKEPAPGPSSAPDSPENWLEAHLHPHPNIYKKLGNYRTPTKAFNIGTELKSTVQDLTVYLHSKLTSPLGSKLHPYDCNIYLNKLTSTVLLEHADTFKKVKERNPFLRGPYDLYYSWDKV